MQSMDIWTSMDYRQYTVDIDDLEEEKRLLKAQLNKSYKRGKPQPRKRRNWKKKPVKK